MELLKNLFEGYPNLWGGGVAHSVLILSLVIAFGIMLGKIKISGISLGVTWILFVGIVFGHFNLNLNEHLLHFLKEFGLILFVYSIGLQVGPGFFSAFKKGGFTLNMLAMGAIFISVVITIILHFTTGTPITTMVGILSGAVTNTPGLGAAQQANSDLNGIDAPEIAMGYAVAYPLGVVGAILSLLALKYILNIKTSQEEADAEKGLGHLQELTVRPVTLEIKNEAIHGKTIKEIRPLVNRNFVISRIRHHDGQQEVELVNSETILHIDDKILVISNPIDIEEKTDDLMLFIDEIHTIMGMGASDGSVDAGNLLKPMLARGNIRVIGATTLDEYKKYIEKDKALERRFQPVMVDEPSVETAISIMRGLKNKYEVFHGIKILDEALVQAVKLSDRYITDRYLPDKAIDLIDEAASSLRINIDTMPEDIDIYTREKLQLEIERNALIEENSKEAENKIAKISKKIENLEAKISKLKDQWIQEKKIINNTTTVKKNIEILKSQIEIAQKKGELTTSLEVKYKQMLEMEKKLRRWNVMQKI